MSRRYVYFVSFMVAGPSGGFGFGNANVTRPLKISSMDTIRVIEEGLHKLDERYSRVTLLNFQLLRVEKAEEAAEEGKE